MIRRVACAALIGVGLAVRGAVVFGQDAPPPPRALSLVRGEMSAVAVEGVERVAIADPAVADVLILSEDQLLIQATGAGRTNLIIWDRRGQTTFHLTVEDPVPAQVAQELQRLLGQMGLASVQVKREGPNLFLTGEVLTEEDLGRLEQLLTAYDGQTTNLVKLSLAAPAPAIPSVPLVKLMVQLIDLDRSDLKESGIAWPQTVTVTEPKQTDQTLHKALSRWGASVERESVKGIITALVQEGRARILTEPTLVTSSGKEASSFVGLDVPVIQAATFGVGSSQGAAQANVEFRQTGVLLKITPTVLADRVINTVIEAELSDIDTASGVNIPVGDQTAFVSGFKVRKTNTEVLIPSGETIVISGLLDIEDTSTESRVPGLSNIPVLGRLFRSPEVKATKREIVITVTPELLGEEEPDAKPDRSAVLEEALAAAEVTASVDDPHLRYALQVQQKIAKQLRYPEREKELGIDGTVKLRLHLFADGTLGRVMVAESSGIEALDVEALKVTESLAPYPAFPSELSEADLWLEVPIIFRP